MDRERVTPVKEIVGELLFEKQKEGKTNDGHGSPLVLLAGEKDMHRRIGMDTTPGCIHLLTGFRKK